jgi:hypothetical protein
MRESSPCGRRLRLEEAAYIILADSDSGAISGRARAVDCIVQVGLVRMAQSVQASMVHAVVVRGDRALRRASELGGRCSDHGHLARSESCGTKENLDRKSSRSPSQGLPPEDVRHLLDAPVAEVRIGPRTRLRATWAWRRHWMEPFRRLGNHWCACGSGIKRRPGPRRKWSYRARVADDAGLDGGGMAREG